MKAMNFYCLLSSDFPLNPNSSSYFNQLEPPQKPSLSPTQSDIKKDHRDCYIPFSLWRPELNIANT